MASQVRGSRGLEPQGDHLVSLVSHSEGPGVEAGFLADPIEEVNVQQRTTTAAAGALTSSFVQQRRDGWPPSSFSLLDFCLSENPGLEGLNLASCPTVEERWLAAISHVKSSKVLTVGRKPPSWWALIALLANSQDLEKLTLGGSGSTPVEFHGFPLLDSLKYLHLSANWMSFRDAMRLIEKAPFLEVLVLHLGDKVEAVDFVPKLPKLRTLSVGKLNSNILLQLLEKNPQLTQLDVRGDSYSGFEPIVSELPCGHLSGLDVSYSNFSAQKLKELSLRCPLIEKLVCSNEESYEGEDWNGLSELRPLGHLKYLDLRGKEISDEQLKLLLLKCPRLENLLVSNVTKSRSDLLTLRFPNQLDPPNKIPGDVQFSVSSSVSSKDDHERKEEGS